MDALVDDSLPPPCPAHFNLAAYVLAPAAGQPGKTALAVVDPTGETRWSYARLEAAVRGAASMLIADGLEPGDRVLMRLGNTVEFPVAFLAALTADLVPVPTSSLLTGPEISRIATEIAPRLIIAGPGMALPDPLPCPVLDAAALADAADRAPLPYAMGDPDRPGYVIYTSGTSGVPRAVVHSHRAAWARRMMWDGWYGLRGTDRLLHAGAFNWTYTLGTGLLDPWARGATALIPGQAVTPDQLPRLIQKHEASIFAAAPGVYRRILKSPMPTVPNLRHGLSAGEKLPERTRAAWHAATGTEVYEAFGMSECSTFISGSPSRPAAPGTLGYAQPGRRVAVLDADGAIVPRGMPGTLAVSSRDPGLMCGYFGADVATRSKFHGEWFLTGDTVEMANDGALRYLGRGDDMMNAGGVRVSPIEVETALTAHPDIDECAAAEVTVKADTTVIAAFYVGHGQVNEAELKSFAAARLAKYKCPRIYSRVEALPKGANGKILRRDLRTTYEAAHGQA